MARKRDRWTRERANRVRPTSQAPKDGWLLTELAQLTEIPASTVRYYVQQRLLRPIEFRGTATRYSRRELMMLLGLHRLEVEGDLTLIERKRRLEERTEQELEQLIGSGPIPDQAAVALGFELTGPTPPDDNSSRDVLVPKLGCDLVETWQRIALLPGLELMLRADAQPVAQAAAQRICSEYSSRSGDGRHGLE